MLYTAFDIDVAKEVWQEEAKQEGIQKDHNNPDTDGDGVLDGDELVPVFLTADVPSFINGNNYFRMISDPTMHDLDMDGLADFM